MKTRQMVSFSALMVTVALVFTACPAPVIVPPSVGAQKFDAVLTAKAFEANAVKNVSEIDNEGAKIKVTEVSRQTSGGKTESVMLLEQADGTFQMNTFSVPNNVDEVNANGYDSSFMTELLADNGSVIGSNTFGELKDEVGVQYAWFVWPVLKKVAGALFRAYGKNLSSKGCAFIVDYVKKNWWRGLPSWFSQPACQYIIYFAANKIFSSVLKNSTTAQTPTLFILNRQRLVFMRS